MSNAPSKPTPDSPLVNDLLDALHRVFGEHPGFRPVHAKGAMCSGTFTPSPGASELTRAPHVQRPSTRVVVRFSDFAGVPTVPDNDPNGAGPRGMAVRFYLGEHAHTDIVAHSENGFPFRTGEEFVEFARAIAASGPDATKPTAFEKFLAAHPRAKAFVEDPKPIPTSFAREAFFAASAFRFTNGKGESRFGRYQLRPKAGTDYLGTADAAAKSANFLVDELSARLANGAIEFRLVVQMAEAGDELADASVRWPDSRRQVELGLISLTRREDDDAPELRKIIFDPIPRVDGIDPSDDPLFQVRADLYLLSGRRRRAATAR